MTDRIEDCIFFHSGGRAKKIKIAKSGGLALWTDKDKIDGKKNINIRGNGEDPSFRD